LPAITLVTLILGGLVAAGVESPLRDLLIADFRRGNFVTL